MVYHSDALLINRLRGNRTYISVNKRLWPWSDIHSLQLDSLAPGTNNSYRQQNECDRTRKR